MPIWVNYIIQGLSLILQILNGITAMKHGVTTGSMALFTGTSVIQGITGIVAHFFTPKGNSIPKGS